MDDRQVNLTRFPLRFPEKRQFFLECRNFFGLSGYEDVYFSRRIGLNDGRPQWIDYGAKVTGQAGAFDVGMLQVRTAEIASTESGRTLGEDFTVFRGRRRFMNESHMGTRYTRRAARPSEFAGVAASPGDARHTIAVDFRLATSRFRGNQNLASQAHHIDTTNPDGRGKSARYGAEIDYPDDRFAARIPGATISAAREPTTVRRCRSARATDSSLNSVVNGAASNCRKENSRQAFSERRSTASSDRGFRFRATYNTIRSVV